MVLFSAIKTDIRNLLNEPDSIAEAARFYTDTEIYAWMNMALTELCNNSDINYKEKSISLTHDTYGYAFSLFDSSQPIFDRSELWYHSTTWDSKDYRELVIADIRQFNAFKTETTPVCSISEDAITLNLNPTTADTITLCGRFGISDLTSGSTFPFDNTVKNAIIKYSVGIGYMKMNNDYGTFWLGLWKTEKNNIINDSKKNVSKNFLKGLSVVKRPNWPVFSNEITGV